MPFRWLKSLEGPARDGKYDAIMRLLHVSLIISGGRPSRNARSLLEIVAILERSLCITLDNYKLTPICLKVDFVLRAKNYKKEKKIR